jgi:hypothetical protein
MFYGANVWDPRLITSQILSMQCIYYVMLGFLLWLLDSVSGNFLSLSQIFGPESMHFQSLLGIVTIFAFLISSVGM